MRLKLIMIGVLTSLCVGGLHPADLALAQAGAAGATLRIADKNIAIWMKLNNSFTGDIRTEHDLGNALDLRDGVLIQLGAHRPPGVEFDRVDLYADKDMEDLVVSLKKSEFVWINILTDYDWNERKLTDPITDLDQAFELYENDHRSTPCDTLESLLNVLDSGLRECVWLRKLHRTFDTEGIITYWPGASGYSMAVTDATGPTDSGIFPPALLTTEFHFPEDIRVEVYQVSEGHMKPSGTHENIKLIVVWPEGGGPTHGGSHDPPFPPTSGGGG